MSHADFYINVGRNIRRAREDCGLTQEELAHVVSLTRTSITNIEAGRQKILLHVLSKIATALQVDPCSLFPKQLVNTQSREIEENLPKDLPKDEKEWIRAVVNIVNKEE